MTVGFWIVKALTTSMGESASDYLVYAMVPEIAVGLAFVALLVALVVQFRVGRYVAWAYWFAVSMVGIFGTMAADAMHVALGVPYAASTILYGVVLAAVFFTWHRVEGTLSVHSIDTPRREAFYWAAVASTFAMGTALGDVTANTLGLGYFPSAVLFAVLISLPAIAYRFFRLDPVIAFWASYVVTRPLGASIADGLAKPTAASGLGWGDGPVALGLAGCIVVGVAWFAWSKSDVQVSADTPDESA
ncbi:MAG: hypothetical protein JST73_00565 [Actinobacteria bacterium]|nr:hypothetical protein [Actinomycetota bacterium]